MDTANQPPQISLIHDILIPAILAAFFVAMAVHFSDPLLRGLVLGAWAGSMAGWLLRSRKPAHRAAVAFIALVPPAAVMAVLDWNGQMTGWGLPLPALMTISILSMLMTVIGFAAGTLGRAAAGLPTVFDRRTEDAPSA